MALYPAPSANVPTFNNDLFSNTIGYGIPNYATVLAFPTAQGTETWTNGIATTVISDSLISLATTAFGASQGVSFNYNGFSYNNGTTTATTTWSSLQTLSTQSGTTSAITSLSGTVNFSPAFSSAPKVIVSLNLNGTTTFIPIGVTSISTSSFSWAAATTSATATITWFATL